MDKILFSLTVKAAVGGVLAHRCVKFDGSQGDTVGGKVQGIAEYNEAEGRPVAVAMLGTKTAISGAAFNKGDDLVCDAEGRLITNPAAGGEFIVATALEDAAAADEEREVYLRLQST